MTGRPSLNVDAGELPGEPEELYALADVVNVACGGHAGDEASMRRVLAFCKQSEVRSGGGRGPTRAGAHPSYPDREGFGRRPVAMSNEALAASVAEQCRALAAAARAEGTTLRYAKLHGALYHAAVADAAVARAALRGVVEALGADVTIIGPPRGALPAAARALGLAYAREGFADRAARADGTLVPRGEPGAMIDDPTEAAARALALLAGDVDTVCVHGDGPRALEIARAVRRALSGA